MKNQQRVKKKRSVLNLFSERRNILSSRLLINRSSGKTISKSKERFFVRKTHLSSSLISQRFIDDDYDNKTSRSRVLLATFDSTRNVKRSGDRQRIHRVAAGQKLQSRKERKEAWRGGSSKGFFRCLVVKNARRT